MQNRDYRLNRVRQQVNGGALRYNYGLKWPGTVKFSARFAEAIREKSFPGQAENRKKILWRFFKMNLS